MPQLVLRTYNLTEPECWWQRQQQYVLEQLLPVEELLFRSASRVQHSSVSAVWTKCFWVQFTRLIVSSRIVSHCAKIIPMEYPMVLWGKEGAWISKQHKAMRNFKGNGTITANKILEANKCVCLCLWQWLMGVNRGISSHLRSLNASRSHNWIKSGCQGVA